MTIRLIGTESGTLYAYDGEWIARRASSPDNEVSFGSSPLRVLTPLPEAPLTGQRALLHVEDTEDDRESGVVWTTSFVILDINLTEQQFGILADALGI